MKNLIILTLIALATVCVLGGLSYVTASWYVNLDPAATTAIWPIFWSVFNSILLLATLLVVAYYTYETYHLRKATVDSNTLSFRPILIFDAGAPFCTVKNKGNGPALNISLIIWDGAKMKVTADNAVPGIMSTGNDSYCFNAHVEIDSAGFKKDYRVFLP